MSAPAEQITEHGEPEHGELEYVEPEHVEPEQELSGLRLVEVDRTLPDFLTMHEGHTDPRYVLRSEWARAFSELGLEPVMNCKFPLRGYRFNPTQYELQRLLESNEAGRTRHEAIVEGEKLYKKRNKKKPGPRTIITLVKDAFRRVATLLPQDVELFEYGGGVPGFLRLKAVDDSRNSAFVHVPDELLVKRGFQIAEQRLNGQQPGMPLSEYQNIFCDGRYPLEALHRRGNTFKLYAEDGAVNASDYAAILAELIVGKFYTSRSSEYDVSIWEALGLHDLRGVSFADTVELIAALKGGSRTHTVRVGVNLAIERMLEQNDILLVDSHVVDCGDRKLNVVDKLRMNPKYRFVIDADCHADCVRAAAALYARRMKSAPRQMPDNWKEIYQLPLVEVSPSTEDDEAALIENEQNPVDLNNQSLLRGWSECLLKRSGEKNKAAMAILAFVLAQTPDLDLTSLEPLKRLLSSNNWLPRKDDGSNYGPDKVGQKLCYGFKVLESLYPGFIKRKRTNAWLLVELDSEKAEGLFPGGTRDIVKSIIYAVLAESLIGTPMALELSDDCRYITVGLDRYEIPETLTVYGQEFEVPDKCTLEELFLELKDEIEKEIGEAGASSRRQACRRQAGRVLAMAEQSGSQCGLPVSGVGSPNKPPFKAPAVWTPASRAALREELRREFDLSYVKGRPAVCAQGMVGDRRNYLDGMTSSVKAGLEDVITAISRPHLNKRKIYKPVAKRSRGHEGTLSFDLLSKTGCRVLTGIKDHPMYEELAIRHGLQSSANANMILVQALSGCEGEIFCVKESDIEPTTLRELMPRPKLRFVVPAEEK